MNQTSGRVRGRFGIALIAGTLVAGAIGLSSTPASGADAPEATDPVPNSAFGTLTIEIGNRAGNVSLELVDGTTYSQPLVTQQPCAQVGYGSVAPASGSTGSLVNLIAVVNGTTGPADTVQIPSNALGVNSGVNCGQPASVIGPNELLEIELGPFFDQFRSDPATPAVVAASANLVIEKEANNSGSLTVGYDGAAQGGSISVKTGSSNVAVQPADPFTSLTVGSTSNKDNRGLSVGTLTSFELVGPSAEFEVAVDCGEQVTQLGEPGDIASSAVFFRGENGTNAAKPNGDCEDVGVIVEIESGDAPDGSGDHVYWNNAAVGVGGTPQQVAGTITIVWSPKPVAAVGDPTQIDYDADGPGGYSDALWCESFSRTVVGGNVTFDAEQPFYDGPGANGDNTAPWCVVSSTDVLNGDGTVTRTQEFFGSGDPWGRY